MADDYYITVENKFRKEKRDINVYNQATKGAHIISYNSSVTLPLQSDEEGDYLHISLVSGPGNLWDDCLIDIPLRFDFEFSTEGKVTVKHRGDRLILNIPPGPPTWQLKMTRPAGCPANGREDMVILGDNGMVKSNRKGNFP